MSASKKTAGVGVSTLSLPEDILVEILSKLTAKSLIRFRCVSKSFCALIADHGFGVLHRSLSLTLPSRTGVLISIESRTPHSGAVGPRAYYTLNFSEEENPRHCHRRGTLQANRVGYLDAKPNLLSSSFDGLICVSLPNGDVAVCNVSTGQRIFLPTIQYKENFALLLGYDSESKRYKVLMSVSKNIGKNIMGKVIEPLCYEHKHWVFTVGVDKSWRKIKNYCSNPFFPFNGGCGSSTHVYIDDVIYCYNWRTNNWWTKPDIISRFHIIAFDLGCESFSVINLPDEVSSLEFSDARSLLLLKSALLEVDGGRLAMVVVGELRGLWYMNVWTWEKSKECWEKITITIPLEGSRMINNGRKRMIRFATNYAREIVLLCIYNQQISILVCNLKSKVCREFDVNGVEEFPKFGGWEVTGVVDHVFPLE